LFAVQHPDFCRLAAVYTSQSDRQTRLNRISVVVMVLCDDVFTGYSTTLTLSRTKFLTKSLSHWKFLSRMTDFKFDLIRAICALFTV
jgi:hypothetical protein